MPAPRSMACRLLILAVALALTGCEGDSKIHAQKPADARARLTYRNKLDKDNWLSPAEASRMIRETPDLQLVCVSNIEDYRAGHLPDSMMIPVLALRMAIEGDKPVTIYSEINRNRALSKDRPILIYCWWNACACPTVPAYSELARTILRRMEFKKVYSVEGGMRAWIAGKLPYEKGEPSPSVTKPTTRPTAQQRRGHSP